MIGRILEFLFSLEHVRLTGGTRFEFVWNYPVLITLGALLLGVLGYLSYLPQSASPRKKMWMGITRALLLMLVFILIWRPRLVVEHEERTRSVVAVWVDTSASMTLEDPYSGAATDARLREYVRLATQQINEATATDAANSSRTRVNRYELALDALKRAKWLKELTQTQDVSIFKGSGHAQLLGTAHSAEQVDALLHDLSKVKPDGETTDVPAVVQEILQSVQGQRLSAVVLFTDGQTTEKGSRLDAATELAQRSSAKIFSIPLGQSDEPFDIKLANMHMPEQTFVKDPIAVRLHVAGSGITQATPVRINIYRKPPTVPGSATAPSPTALGTPLATKDVTLEPTKKEMDVDIALHLLKKSPDKGERFDLIARIDPINPQEELTTKNNGVSGATTVLDAQMNVLYVEGYPRWEFRYLKNELVREPTINVSTLLLSADIDFTQDADPPVKDKQTGEETFPGPIQRFPETAQELAKYDVILIGDVEPTFFSPTQQKLIVDLVYKRGGGIGWIAGMGWNPEAYRDTPLDVLLPIIPDEFDPRARIMAPADNDPFNVVLTAAGRESNLFRFFDDQELNDKQIPLLPEMYWYKPVQGLVPQATVLAVHPSRSQGGRPAPLLVTGQYGEGRTLFSAFCDTWRWRRYTGEPLFQSYWLQLCRLLYANKALGQSKRLELLAESTRIEVGKPIKVTLNIKDPTLTGQMPAEVPVQIMDNQGRVVETINLSRSMTGGAAGAGGAGRGAGTGGAGGAGAGDGALERMEGTATASRIGEFTLTIQPGLLPVDIPPTELVVEPPQREFEKITVDTESLKLLATKTTGDVLEPYRAEELARLIPDRSIPVLISQSEELWNKPIALILVIMIASIEWLIRKSAGLI